MKFEKVSFEQFKNDYINTFYQYESQLPLGIDEYIKDCYDNIVIPTRATRGSAGYDFVMPFDVQFDSFTDIKIPTGVKCQIDDGYFLMVVPRSSMGFKNYLRLANTLGIVDSDYYNNKDNEGHIFAKVRIERTLDNPLVIKRGERFVQGIFIPYGLTDNDKTESERVGGIGSSGF